MIKRQDTVTKGDSQGGPLWDRSALLRIDPVLLFAVVGLLVLSLLTIGFATKDDIPNQPYYYVIRQSIYAVVGLGIMIGLAGLNYSRLREFKFHIYGSMLFMIVVVLILGSAAKGSRRWIELPFFRFQPSELGKLLLVIAVSAFIIDRTRRSSPHKVTLQTLGMTTIPALLVIIQPDLGTGLVYFAILIVLLFIAGQPWQHFLVFGLAFAACLVFVFSLGPSIGVNVLKPYQMDRLTAFLNPSDDPSEEGYQQAQSRIAIGSGERLGRGPQRATQTKLNFLPEHHTDFIFAVVGETYGFVGGGTVLALFTLLIWRGLRTVTLAKDMFGALITSGIVVMLLFQIVVNIGMTIGIMPITGIPLPLLSYGGSSLLVTLTALGLLQAVYAQGKKRPKGGSKLSVDNNQTTILGSEI